MKKKEVIILVLLASLNFTHILDFMIMMPLGNYLIASFGINTVEFSVLVAAYSISAFFSGLAVAMFIDKYDRKKSLLLAYSGFVIATIACGLAYNYGLLLAARIVAGLFGGVIGAQVLAIVADMFVYEKRAHAMGAVMGGFAAASIIGVPVSLYLTNFFHNWHVPFILIGALGAIFIPLIVRYIPRMTSHIRKEKSDRSIFEALIHVCQVPAQRSALIFSCLLMIGHFLIIPFINPYLEFNLGFSKTLTPALFFVGGIASLLAALVLGKVADKHGKLSVFTISVLLSLVMVIIITRMPNVPFTIVLLFFAIWFVVATGRIVTAQAMISEVVNPSQRGSFMSINGSIQQLGSGIAALCAGAIIFTDKAGKIHNYSWVGYLSIVVLVACLLYGRLIFKKIDSSYSGLEEEDLVIENREQFEDLKI